MLPYGVHLKLCQRDLHLIQTEINKMFDEDGLKSMAKLYKTNMCESLHSTVYRLAPKLICWSRNFQALCHSAVHSPSLGQSQSTIQLAKAAGISVHKNSQFYRQLKLKDPSRRYDSERRGTHEYKQRRYILRK